MTRILCFLFTLLQTEALFGQVEVIRDARAFESNPAFAELRVRISPSNQAMFDPIGPDLVPNAAAIVESVGALVNQQLVPGKETKVRTYVMVTRSLHANAMYSELNSGDRVVIVTLGLLRLLKNEGQFAGIVGHELEHGVSDLQELIKLEPEQLRRRLLQRLVENEVDINSAFRRLIPIGANPHAMKSALRLLREKYGNTLGSTHTTFSTREAALDTALAVARREHGLEKIPLDEVPRLPDGVIAKIKTLGYSHEEMNEKALRYAESKIQGWLSDFIERDMTLSETDASLNSTRTGAHNSFVNLQVLLRSYTDEHLSWTLWRGTLIRVHMEVQRLYGEEYAKILDEIGDLNKAKEAKIKALLKQTEHPTLEQEIRGLEGDVTRESERFERLNKNPSDYQSKFEADFYQQEIALQEKRLNEAKARWQAYLALEAAFIRDRPAFKLSAARLAIVTTYLHRFGTIYDGKLMSELDPASQPALMEQISLAIIKRTRVSRLDYRSLSVTGPSFWGGLYKLDFEIMRRVFAEYCRTLAIALSPDIVADRTWDGYLYLQKIIELPKRKVEKHALRQLATAQLNSALGTVFIEAIAEDVNSTESEHKGLDRQLSVLSAVTYTIENYGALLDQLRKAGVEVNLDVQPSGSLPWTAVHLDHLHGQLPPSLQNDLPAKTFRRLLELSVIGDTGLHAQLHVEPLANQEIARLVEAGKLLEAHPTLSELTDTNWTLKKIVGEILKANRLDNFEVLASRFDDLVRKDAPKFFEVVFAVSQLTTMHFERSFEPPRPVVDAEGKLQIAYAAWLLERHPEAEATPQLFKSPDLIRSKFNSEMTPTEISNLDQAEEALDRMDMAKLKQIEIKLIVARLRTLKDRHTADQVIRIVAAEIDNVNFWPIVDDVAEASGLPKLEIIEAIIKNLGHASSDDYEAASARLRAEVDAASSQHELKAVYLIYHELFEKIRKRTPVVIDGDVEYLWIKSEKFDQSDDLRRQLASEPLVSRITSHQLKMRLFNFRYQSVDTRSVTKPESLAEIRPEVQSAVSLLLELFPQPSYTRDTCIDQVGKQLVTNPAETDLLYNLATNLKNYQNSNAILFIDAPGLLAQSIRTVREKMLALRFLMGEVSAAELEDALRDPRVKRESFVDAANIIRQNYRDANLPIRTFVLLSLLDDFDGLLKEENGRSEVKKLVLGKYQNSLVASAVYDAYLASLPSGEGRVVISAILANQINPEGNARGVVSSLIHGLNAMGWKGAQTYRASGQAPTWLHEELDASFDSASEVRRDDALGQLRKAFGHELRGISYFGQGLGFGSVNHVWHVDFEKQGEVVETAVRLQRENVAAQSRNENQVWIKTVDHLNGHPSSEVRAFAATVEQIRAAIVPSLLPGGSETDSERERAMFKAVEGAYTGLGERSGRRVELARPVDFAHDLIDEAYRPLVSVTRFVRQQKLADHPDRAKLAEDVLRSELRAIFTIGAFDPDGHIGNWLPDNANNELVRIDWAQFTRMSNEEKLAHREVIKAVLSENLSQENIKTLQTYAKAIFDEPEPEVLALIEARVAALRHLTGTNPVERLYFLRKTLEEHLRGSVSDTYLLRLSPVTSKILMSLTKTQIYSEPLGKLRYRRIVLQELGVSRTKALRLGISSATRAVKSRCAILFGRN